MRYRIGKELQQPGPPISGEMLIFTVVLGLLIGMTLFVLGMRGRQMWLTVWGGGWCLPAWYTWLRLVWELSKIETWLCRMYIANYYSEHQ